MFLRYFALMNGTELGRAAALYCEALSGLGKPVRLVPTLTAELQVDQHGRTDLVWGGFRNLLVTAMAGDFVNVVCAEAKDWERLYTGQRRNVLLLAAPHALALETKDTTVHVTALAKYDMVFAAAPIVRDLFELASGRRIPMVPVGTKAASGVLQGMLA